MTYSLWIPFKAPKSLLDRSLELKPYKKRSLKRAKTLTYYNLFEGYGPQVKKAQGFSSIVVKKNLLNFYIPCVDLTQIYGQKSFFFYRKAHLFKKLIHSGLVIVIPKGSFLNRVPRSHILAHLCEYLQWTIDQVTSILSFNTLKVLTLMDLSDKEIEFLSKLHGIEKVF